MNQFLNFVATILAIFGPASASNIEYSEGQVWEYQARPQDQDSILKIQKIENIGVGDEEITVFHISVIGVSPADARSGTEFPHLPVSKETLDQSVTRLSSSNALFPDPSEGMDTWRKAEGGVFSISVAEIIQIGEDTVAGYSEQ